MGFVKGYDPKRYVGGKPKGKTKTTLLRERMHKDAENIIDMFKEAILKGTIDGQKVSVKQRTELMKSFMPYVLPQLKSVELNTKSDDAVQPLIINLAGTNGSKSPPEVVIDEDSIHIDYHDGPTEITESSTACMEVSITKAMESSIIDGEVINLDTGEITAPDKG